MDPLSVTASIVGLLTAAGKIHGLLETLSSVRNAPTTIRDAQRETRHTEIALRALQRFLQRLDPTNPRLELIQVDELRIVLADAMLVFSSFESMLQLLARLARVRAAISWAKYSKQIDEHTGKLERYKSSLSFMLSILQCSSDVEAHQSQIKLHGLVEQALAENEQLRQKLQDSQDSFDARSIATRRLDNDDATVRQDDTSTIRGLGVGRSNTVRSTVGNFGSSMIKFAFENILEQSRVYRKTTRFQELECDRSFASSAIRSHAWSVFTGYSLAEISVLSMIAMPITTVDISNGRYYVDPVDNGQESEEADMEAPVESHTLHLGTTTANGQEASTTDHIGPPDNVSAAVYDISAVLTGKKGKQIADETEPPKIQIAPEFPSWTVDLPLFCDPPNPAATLRHVHQPSDATDSLNETLKSFQSESTGPGTGGTPATSVDGASVQEVEEPDADGSDTFSITDSLKEFFEGGHIEGDHLSDHPVYKCTGCDEILEEGKAYQLSGMRWHLDCFKCSKCNDLLDSDSTNLLLGNGDLICRKCTPRCTSCAKEIEDVAIMAAGGDTYCADCFRCVNCKKKIKDLRYARTSQGYFCMNCHEHFMAKKMGNRTYDRKQKVEEANARLRKEAEAKAAEGRMDSPSPDQEVPIHDMTWTSEPERKAASLAEVMEANAAQAERST